MLKGLFWLNNKQWLRYIRSRQRDLQYLSTTKLGAFSFALQFGGDVANCVFQLCFCDPPTADYASIVVATGPVLFVGSCGCWI
jgi:hypothetical protein